MDPNQLTVGDVVVNVHLNQIVIRGNRSEAQARVLAMLALLARRAGESVSLDELRTGLHGSPVYGRRSVVIAIHRARKAIQDSENVAIETVRGVGYRLVVREGGANE